MAYRKGKPVVLAWKDKRIVTLLSTRNEAGFMSIHKRVRSGKLVRIQKPKMVMDKKYSCSRSIRPICFNILFFKKIPEMKLFFCGMEMCGINSYILYTSTDNMKNQCLI